MNRAASYHQHVFLCCCRKIRIPAQKGQFFQILYCKRIQSSMNQIRTNKQHCNMSSCQLWQVWLQITAWTLSKAATFYPNVFLFLPELLNLLFVLLKQKKCFEKTNSTEDNTFEWKQQPSCKRGRIQFRFWMRYLQL